MASPLMPAGPSTPARSAPDSFLSKAKTYTFAIAAVSALGAAFFGMTSLSRIPGLAAVNHSAWGITLFVAALGSTVGFGIATVALHKKEKTRKAKETEAAPSGVNETPAAPLQEASMDQVIVPNANNIVFEVHVHEMSPPQTEVTAHYLSKHRYNTNITVVDQGTLDGAKNFEGKTAVLNFANAMYPGSAQEGYLIQNSKQYPKGVKGYQLGRSLLAVRDKLFLDGKIKETDPYIPLEGCIYLDNITYVIDGKDKDLATISAAAPDRKSRPFSAMQEFELIEIMENTITSVLTAARKNGVKNIVLGAFGCGVFGWDAELVAKIFRYKVYVEFAGVFENVVFAVPKGSKPENYEKFVTAYAGFSPEGKADGELLSYRNPD